MQPVDEAHDEARWHFNLNRSRTMLTLGNLNSRYLHIHDLPESGGACVTVKGYSIEQIRIAGCCRIVYALWFLETDTGLLEGRHDEDRYRRVGLLGWH